MREKVSRSDKKTSCIRLVFATMTAQLIFEVSLSSSSFRCQEEGIEAQGNKADNIVTLKLLAEVRWQALHPASEGCLQV